MALGAEEEGWGQSLWAEIGSAEEETALLGLRKLTLDQTAALGVRRDALEQGIWLAHW